MGTKHKNNENNVTRDNGHEEDMTSMYLIQGKFKCPNNKWSWPKPDFETVESEKCADEPTKQAS